MVVIRYADDTVQGFQYERDAYTFRQALAGRLAKFGLDLHPDKSRLIEFGRFASAKGFGEAGNFRVSGLYSLLHPISPKWLVQECPRNVAQATAGAVAGGKRRPATANKSAHWRNRALAPPSNPGAHELLRRPWKRGEGVGVRVPGISAMAPDAPASQPTPPNALVTLRCDP